MHKAARPSRAWTLQNAALALLLTALFALLHLLNIWQVGSWRYVLVQTICAFVLGSMLLVLRLQSGSLFQGDVYSNITISAPQLTLNEAWEAAEMAGRLVAWETSLATFSTILSTRCIFSSMAVLMDLVSSTLSR